MTDYNRFQRVGSDHNSGVGRTFEDAVQAHFARLGVELTRNLSVPIGVGGKKKARRFDLGSEAPPILVECKSHTWTTGGNMPSAKMTVWNEAMFYFFIAPSRYRKALFVLRDLHTRSGESLAAYYLRTYEHLVPGDVEMWELEADTWAETRVR